MCLSKYNIFNLLQLCKAIVKIANVIEHCNALCSEFCCFYLKISNEVGT